VGDRIDDLIEEITADAYGDHEQLGSFCQVFEDEARFPFRGRVVGVEVKATAAPTMDMARHLIWMRDELGEAFTMGVLLHTGPAQIRLAPKVVALPIWALWTTDAGG